MQPSTPGIARDVASSPSPEPGTSTPTLHYRSPAGLARWLRRSLYVYSVYGGLLAALAVPIYRAGGMGKVETELLLILGITLDGFLALLALPLCIILFLCFLYRATRNAHALGIHPVGHTPAAAVYCFFVPFANLVMPYQLYRDVYESSTPAGEPLDVPKFVPVWWGVYLASGAIGWISGRIPEDSLELAMVFDLVLGLSNLASGLLAARVVRALASRQDLAARALAFA